MVGIGPLVADTRKRVRENAMDQPRGLGETQAVEGLRETLAFSRRLEAYISNPRRGGVERNVVDDRETLIEICNAAAHTARGCQVFRKANDASRQTTDVQGLSSNAAALVLASLDANARISKSVIKYAQRFTDTLPLRQYLGLVRYIPQAVNIVTLARVEPSPGSKTVLPLSLHHIATHCAGAFFAPDRFAAVQLASHKTPRARVLVFHTGKLVGTGTTGVMSARLAIMQAVAQLAEEAGVYLDVKSFDIINIVGAVTLGATVNCEAFAQAHSSEVHYDRSSFVGMTWRPRGVPVCAEVYSTGRINVPGGKTHRDLLVGFAQLAPELLRFSSSAPLHGGSAKVDNAVDAVDAVDDGNVSVEGHRDVKMDGPGRSVPLNSEHLWDGWGVV